MGYRLACPNKLSRPAGQLADLSAGQLADSKSNLRVKYFPSSLPIISPKSLSLSQSQKRESPFKGPGGPEAGSSELRPLRPPSFFRGEFAAETGAKPQKSTSNSLIADILHLNPFVFIGLEQVIASISD
jgi:hypothetical protein